MFKIKEITRLNDLFYNLRYAVQDNIEPYKKTLEQINAIKLTSYSDAGLKEMASSLQNRCRRGAHPDQLLVESFALTKEAAHRVLGLYPFDVQVMAGVALHEGKVVEMQTGEGKTLAAVFPAWLNALNGKGVHVLTFNDYLARRDAFWMGPIYEFLGLSVAYVNEGMDIKERKAAYLSDITYVTAKEAGFDYLRDFLCAVKENVVHRPFHYAIVDEADSILIDEARIPLVIAANVAESEGSVLHLAELVRQLKAEAHYEVARGTGTVNLTDAGLFYAEKMLGCVNLYEQENLELLARLHCALQARVLLTRDKDYIVKQGKVEIVDELTGRIAEKRHWPDNLQEAVEAKEGLVSYSGGRIMGSIALQYYLGLYPKLSGMTGTARVAAEEFKECYGLEVVLIPTNSPSIRIDHPPLIFPRKKDVQQSLIAEINRAHGNAQPVLIGTASVEESEELAAALREAGMPCHILNARHDEMEAKIIARAGEPGAVTVSTNMAGRGVDIKLGGEKEQERDRVVAAGGLYVIGTNIHESRRIDDQLRGRAGRQGDPGESRFFLSLENDLFKQHLAQGLAVHDCSWREGEAIYDPALKRQMERIQRVIEGYNADMRRQMWQYSRIMEQQRQIVHARRQDILMDRVQPHLLSDRAAPRYASLCKHWGEAALQKAEKELTLYFISKCWADYLDYMAAVREEIHLVVIGKQNPLDEFHRIAVTAFAEMMTHLETEIIGAFNTLEMREEGIDLEKEGLMGPSSTWTYLINDSPDQFSNLPNLVKATTTMISGPLFTVQSLFKRIFRR